LENFGFSQSDMESIQGGLDSSGATGGVSPSQQDQDNYAQATANIIAEPKVGVNRSNVVGMANYDPQFAAALKISRGLNPGVNTGGLDVPSYLQPQLPGNKVLNEAGDRTMYYSPVERFMQEDLADIAQSGIGLTGLVGKGLDALFGGIDFLSNSKAGDTVEKLITETTTNPLTQFDQFGNAYTPIEGGLSGKTTESLSDLQGRRNKIEEMQQNASRAAQLREQGTDPNFIPNTFPTIDRTNVLNNSFMDSGASLATDAEGIASLRPSIAQLSEDRKKQNALNTIFDMLNKDTQNIEIAAGANTGKTLNTALPERRDLNAFTSPGYLQTSNKYTLDEMLNRDLSRPQQGPPERPKKAPPGFVDITIEDSDRPSVFAGTNMPITGGKTIGSKLYSPANELELKAKTDAGFDLYPTPFNFFENTRFAEAESKPGVRLSPASYIFDPGKEEKGTTVRVPISSLPNMAQEVNSLRTDLDYGTSFPLQTILDGRKAINQGQFSQKEMSDFLAGFN